MDNWDEVRTAYQVARMGTVSGAAGVLGVHHATVIRHVDALEGQLGVKLFQRHGRGYTPTEAGEDLLRVAATTEDQFSQLLGRIRGRGNEVCGDLTVTSLASHARWLVPVLAAFQKDHRNVVVRYLTGQRLFRLEYGEAHVAIRTGAAPEEPDNVVQHLMDVAMAPYASRGYVAEFGRPEAPGTYDDHRFIAYENPENPASWMRWLSTEVPDTCVTFRCSDGCEIAAAVRAGAGIGFLAVSAAAQDPDLVQIHPPRKEWQAPVWIVTHVDLHRTAKVQAVLQHIKAGVAGRSL